MVKGYKVFNPDWTCLNFQYKVGETYSVIGPPIPCSYGFHFCEKLSDCFSYYTFNYGNKIAEVIAHGLVVSEGNKSCTNTIEIVREISWEEALKMINSGADNFGRYNSGHNNHGRNNAGDYNVGDKNTGNFNTGERNTGWSNIGCSNAGHRNTGENNAGVYNRGDYNTGSYNIGNRNAGDFNVCDHSSGCFCTETHTIRFFDKESSMTMKDWRTSDAYGLMLELFQEFERWLSTAYMSYEETVAHPEARHTKGVLRRLEDWHLLTNEWWDRLDQSDKVIVVSMPNFDADKFEKIMCITASKVKVFVDEMQKSLDANAGEQK